MKQKTIRLDKYLVHAGCGSRKEVQQMIRKKQVIINEKIVVKPEFAVDIENVQVYVNKRLIEYQPFYHFIMNKPQGVITATEDNMHQTVIDLLDKEDRQKSVIPVGRLDKDTEGLLVLTSDGQLAHQLLSPKKHVPKVYYAEVEGCVTKEDSKIFEEGITLADGTSYAPGTLEIIEAGEISKIYVTISEGKFHQVKRMVQAVGKKVIYLKRMKMGNLELPEDLPVGKYRILTIEELRALKGE